MADRLIPEPEYQRLLAAERELAALRAVIARHGVVVNDDEPMETKDGAKVDLREPWACLGPMA